MFHSYFCVHRFYPVSGRSLTKKTTKFSVLRQNVELNFAKADSRVSNNAGNMQYPAAPVALHESFTYQRNTTNNTEKTTRVSAETSTAIM